MRRCGIWQNGFEPSASRNVTPEMARGRRLGIGFMARSGEDPGDNRGTGDFGIGHAFGTTAMHIIKLRVIDSQLS